MRNTPFLCFTAPRWVGLLRVRIKNKNKSRKKEARNDISHRLPKCAEHPIDDPLWQPVDSVGSEECFVRKRQHQILPAVGKFTLHNK